MAHDLLKNYRDEFLAECARWDSKNPSGYSLKEQSQQPAQYVIALCQTPSPILDVHNGRR